MKYAFIAEQSDSHPVSRFCRVLGVSSSGYYAWRQRGKKPSERQRRGGQIDRAVKHCFDRKKHRYGSPRVALELACDALEMALQRRDYPQQVIVHTDRGSQYCSRLYQRLIKKHQLRCSMSKKGDCFDNAWAETFFHSLKVEAIHGETIPTREIMRKTVFEYIELDYNRTHMHSALGYLSPVEFELQNFA